MGSPEHAVVLVGAGRMGMNHLRVLGEDPAFELRAVVDPRPSAALRNTHPHLPVFASLADLDAAGVDYEAAVIATPTETHLPVAGALLERGKHVLVEKPLASTPAECRKLVDEAARSGVVLAVGHVERFNPAVRKLREVLDKGWLGEPIHFSITRVGGYPEGLEQGNNVLLDLAVHDIDVLHATVGPMEVVASVNHNTVRPDVPDTAEILLRSGDGVSASIHVNWVTPTKIRTIRVTGTRGVCFVDYILQTCTLKGGRLLDPPALRTDFDSLVRQYQGSDTIEFAIQTEEPLKVQLRAFARALDGDLSEICSGEDAALAVEVAHRAVAGKA